MLTEILTKIITTPLLHAKWLNTLSYLENCGAKKIAACEHPTLVKKEMLKHAAEEFRHAHHLKRQMEKIALTPLDDYTNILGGFATRHYLKSLDVYACRLTKVRSIVYVLVTYAIEVRAKKLYEIYDTLLKAAGSKVNVKSILLEEDEHLNEMQGELQKLPHGLYYAEQITQHEHKLYTKWLNAIQKELLS